MSMIDASRKDDFCQDFRITLPTKRSVQKSYWSMIEIIQPKIGM